MDPASDVDLDEAERSAAIATLVAAFVARPG